MTKSYNLIVMQPAASRMLVQTLVNAFTRPFPPCVEVDWPTRQSSYIVHRAENNIYVHMD